MKLTPGKLAGIKAVSDNRDVIAAAAMDQHGSLQKAARGQGKGERKGKPRPEEIERVMSADRLFALVFLSVITMIFMLFVVSSVMSWYSHDKELLSRQTDALLTMAKYGFVAIISLLAGWKLRK